MLCTGLNVYTHLFYTHMREHRHRSSRKATNTNKQPCKTCKYGKTWQGMFFCCLYTSMCVYGCAQCQLSMYMHAHYRLPTHTEACITPDGDPWFTVVSVQNVWVICLPFNHEAITVYICTNLKNCPLESSVKPCVYNKSSLLLHTLRDACRLAMAPVYWSIDLKSIEVKLSDKPSWISDPSHSQPSVTNRGGR